MKRKTKWIGVVLYGKERTMKFTIKLLTVLVLFLATFSPQTTASAKTYRFRTADYYLSTYDASTCIGSYIELEVGEDLLPSLQIYRYDRCQNQSLMEAYGRKELTNSEFKFSGNLDSATLRTTVPMYDYV